MDSISGIGGAGARNDIKKPAGKDDSVPGALTPQQSTPPDTATGRQIAPSDEVSVSDEAHEDGHGSQAAGDSARSATDESATADSATDAQDKKGAQGADSHEHINALRDGIKGKPKAKPAEAWGGCDE